MSAESPITQQRPPSPTSYATKLDSESYTYHRLQHATPEHLYLTTRRCFVGPIPEGWLKNRRRDWYKHQLHINYSSRAATFSANENISRHRRLSGLDGPSSSALYVAKHGSPSRVRKRSGGGQDGKKLRVQETVDEHSVDESSRASHNTPRGVRTSRDLDGRPETTQPSDTAKAKAAATPKAAQSSVAQKSPGFRPPQRASTGDSYVTAPETPITQPLKYVQTLSPSHEQDEDGPSTLSSEGKTSALASVDRPAASGRTSASFIEQSVGQSSPGEGVGSARASSTTPLLKHRQPQNNANYGTDESPPEGAIEEPSAKLKGILSKVSRTKRPEMQEQAPDEAVNTDDEPLNAPDPDIRPVTSGLVRFNVHEAEQYSRKVSNRFTIRSKRRTFRDLRRENVHSGEIIKMERMLVRIDATGQALPDDYDENDSMKTETRPVEKWREYMVVCRDSSDESSEFVLQMYKSRVIHDVEDTQTNKRAAHIVPLSRKTTRVNLYSSLDKTIVIWIPYKTGSHIYIMKPRSGANSMEWYTFLRRILGWNRADILQVNVPDLSVSLRLVNPFESLENSQDVADAAEGDEAAIARTLNAEQVIARRITDRCVEMLEDSPQWGDIVDVWTRNERIGLAWKRYDRLEWVHGANEKKMYGTIAMQKSHELELRPKLHYPTDVKKKTGEKLPEPAPVEGFLVRLTSQRGADQKLGKLFFKRLYFATINQFLVFARPAKAVPPAPPKVVVRDDFNVPSAHEIASTIPLIYAVCPYPVHDGEIAWLAKGQSERRECDAEAYDEAERLVNTLLNCDGYVNLCNVARVRNVVRGATPADENVVEGSEVDFDQDVPDTQQDDGATVKFDDDRTFELLMQNGLVVRLQAYDKATKREWQRRLQDLARYWKRRSAADMDLYKQVRRQNLSELKIDEETEALMGQFARKWEVTKSHASAELYNMCAISCCRTINMSGTLFRKPRRHSTFTRCSVILTHGHLLFFQDTLRNRTGARERHIHNQRIGSIDLADCYLYSGLITENDLLYQNRTFDSNKPGRHALPRIYLEDGWTSIDEDTMTCFVVWHAQRKSIFRSPGEFDSDGGAKEGKRQKLKRVSQLGVPGRSVVFKARSRAERDHWVMAIGMEIERLSRAEDVRIVDGKKG